MPRVNYVKSARKDNPAVSKGEPYFWWKFRYGGKRYSRTRPRPSQLTQSEYLSTIRSLVEQVEDQSFDVGDVEGLEEFRDEILSQLEELREMTQDALDNMPEQLQDGSVSQERLEALEEAISEVESIEAPDDWSDEDTPEEDREEFDESLFIDPIANADL